MMLQTSILKRSIYFYVWCIFVSLIPICSVSAKSVSAEQGYLSKVLNIPWGNAEGEIGLKPGDVGGYWVIPVSFAVDTKTGDIVIADRVNSRISKFNAAGKLILSFVIKIRRFYSPMDIELDSQKRIIVFDNEKIQIFDAQGKLLDVLQIPSTTGGPQESLCVDVTAATSPFFLNICLITNLPGAPINASIWYTSLGQSKMISLASIRSST